MGDGVRRFLSGVCALPWVAAYALTWRRRRRARCRAEEAARERAWRHLRAVGESEEFRSWERAFNSAARANRAASMRLSERRVTH